MNIQSIDRTVNYPKIMEDKQNKTPLVKSKFSYDRLPSSPFKISRQAIFKNSSLQRQPSKKEPFSGHPASRFILASQPPITDFKKFLNIIYQGLFYSICSLKGPTEEFLQKRSIKLPESRTDIRKKFLLLDLDETLIHTFEGVQGEFKTDVQMSEGQQIIRFNLRPYCLQFLENMSRYYDIHIFTASTEDYAKPIVKYLNSKKKTIQSVLHRQHCLETKNGFRIKDLRIIKNRSLNQIIIVDNLVHSFGLQLENGIPILQFIDNKNDRQLLGLQLLLMKIKDEKDVRIWIGQRIGLRKCLQIPQDQFMNVKVLKRGSRFMNK